MLARLVLGLLPLAASYVSAQYGPPQGTATTPSVLPPLQTTAPPTTRANPTTGTTAPAQSAPSGGPNTTKGDTQCIRDMCISGFLTPNSSPQTITYKLTVSQATVGWAAMGFGSQMVNSPMFILYKSPTGEGFVVSQRKTAVYAAPQVDPRPPQIATVDPVLTTSTAASNTFAFTIPDDGGRRPQLIWSWSPTAPSRTGGLVQHVDQGTMSLDFSKTFSSVPSGGNSAQVLPLSRGEMIFLAHGVMMAFIWLLSIPFGALLARLGRTFTHRWFIGHWIVQFGISGLLFIVAFALAVYQVGAVGKPHFAVTTHRTVGLVIFILYWLQVSLGWFIHKVKFQYFAGRRPPQNYLHAVLGLTILGLAFYQIYTGIVQAFPAINGRAVPMDFYRLWAVMISLFAVAYVVGLALLPRQWKQERESREKAKHIPLSITGDVYRPNEGLEARVHRPDQPYPAYAYGDGVNSFGNAAAYRDAPKEDYSYQQPQQQPRWQQEQQQQPRWQEQQPQQQPRWQEEQAYQNQPAAPYQQPSYQQPYQQSQTYQPYVTTGTLAGDGDRKRDDDDDGRMTRTTVLPSYYGGPFAPQGDEDQYGFKKEKEKGGGAVVLQPRGHTPSGSMSSSGGTGRSRPNRV